MVVKHEAAVGNRKEKRLAKVKGGVPSNGQPKISGSLQSEREDQPGNDDISHADHVFALIPTVSGAKRQGEAHGSRPEPNPSRKRVLDVSPEQEFFKQPHKHKSHRPQCSPPEKARALNCQVSERIPAESSDESY